MSKKNSVIVFLIFLSILSFSFFVNDYLDNYGGAVFWLMSFLILTWGIISGLVYKDKKSVFYEYKIIRNAQRSLLFITIVVSIVMSVWIFSMRHSGVSLGREFTFSIILGFLFPAFFLWIPFIFGHTIARLVRFFGRRKIYEKKDGIKELECM